MDLSFNSKYTLSQRYLIKDKDGKIIETPEELFRRVAKVIASADLLYGIDENKVQELENQFFDIMTELEFVPNSPTLMNAGTILGLLSACFRLPMNDDIISIADSLKAMIIIQKMGGGTGFSFSDLRPEGDFIASTGGESSGPLSFMTMFDAATACIKQGGKRRGANMAVMNIHHPDIMKFIYAKIDENNNPYKNFNLSVGVTDKFLQALVQNSTYELINPHTTKVVGNVSAKLVWEHLCALSWMNGEPAVLFLDTIEKYNPTPTLGKLDATNPCGELPLLPFESCNLGSINLSKFVKYNKIDWERLEYVTRLAVRFLDNVIDVNKYPLQEIEDITKANRKIGLGVMGWADMLIELGIEYNSEQAVDLAKNIMNTIQIISHNESSKIGKEKGDFSNKPISTYKYAPNMRNATVTSIAPTGTISIIADCSYGIEPVFSIITKRNVKESLGKSLMEINPAVKKLMKKKGYWTDSFKTALATTDCVKCILIPKDIQEIVPTAQDIKPEWHVKMQAAFQQFTDNSISKTVNLPNSASVEDISNIYLMAYKLGIKGTTVYRDGSRNFQLLEGSNGSCPTCPS
jgi:ribonucleoside-diphosphate reductase alpha chain